MSKSSNMVYKTLVIGVIILFIGVTIAPSITANVDKSSTESFTNPTSGKTIEITVSRYKADSTIEKTKVILSKENALEFKERYRITVDSDKRFSLLKEYGLIPEDVTREQLRQEMLSLADELGFTEEKIESISERFGNKEEDVRLFGINFLNKVNGMAFVTINLPIGLSLITGLLNFFSLIPFDIPSVDLFYSAFFAGIFRFYDGLLPDFYNDRLFCFFSLFGFIGFVWSTPFIGYAVGIEGSTVASFSIPAIMGQD